MTSNTSTKLDPKVANVLNGKAEVSTLTPLERHELVLQFIQEEFNHIIKQEYEENNYNYGVFSTSHIHDVRMP